ncbi:unnamed protein product [Oikopleura dioica]|uniref:Uncharacterized protein n=1 Tax=Oikopleura dioica TaxID=34765 RepID=E4Y129_OIKDI|nr:unnamed protein product [Oikopleura dioica]
MTESLPPNFADDLLLMETVDRTSTLLSPFLHGSEKVVKLLEEAVVIPSGLIDLKLAKENDKVRMTLSEADEDKAAQYAKEFPEFFESKDKVIRWLEGESLEIVEKDLKNSATIDNIVKEAVNNGGILDLRLKQTGKKQITKGMSSEFVISRCGRKKGERHTFDARLKRLSGRTITNTYFYPHGIDIAPAYFHASEGHPFTQFHAIKHAENQTRRLASSIILRPVVMNILMTLAGMDIMEDIYGAGKQMAWEAVEILLKLAPHPSKYEAKKLFNELEGILQDENLEKLRKNVKNLPADEIESVSNLTQLEIEIIARANTTLYTAIGVGVAEFYFEILLTAVREKCCSCSERIEIDPNRSMHPLLCISMAVHNTKKWLKEIIRVAGRQNGENLKINNFQKLRKLVHRVHFAPLIPNKSCKVRRFQTFGNPRYVEEAVEERITIAIAIVDLELIRLQARILSFSLPGKIEKLSLEWIRFLGTQILIPQVKPGRLASSFESVENSKDTSEVLKRRETRVELLREQFYHNANNMNQGDTIIALKEAIKTPGMEIENKSSISMQSVKCVIKGYMLDNTDRNWEWFVDCPSEVREIMHCIEKLKTLPTTTEKF